MTPIADGRGWWADVGVPAGEGTLLIVEAVDSSGRFDPHTIQLTLIGLFPPVHPKNGSDADSIGAWLQNSIVGTPPRPDRNGKPS